jgi:hypothetical protein
MAEKTALAKQFLKFKVQEYELIKVEIEALQRETDSGSTPLRL